EALAKQSLCILWRPQQVSGLLERFIFSEREHDHSLVAVARDNDRCVVFTNAVHSVCKLLSGLRIGDRLHVMDRILSNYLNCNKEQLHRPINACRSPMKRQK